jgi:DNA-binding response OmpR family regulator
MKHRVALVEVGASSCGFQRALATALNGLSLLRADTVDASFGLARQVVLLAGVGVDPVASIHGRAPELRPHVHVTCERAEGSDVARWARAGVRSCYVGVESLAELRATVQSFADNDGFDVLLDASDLAIEVGGVRTRLTKTQFRLLQHLSAKSGHWVTAPELVKEALGTHHENDSALVRVHLHAIRRALGPLAHLIETDPARARGYRFRPDPELR